MKILEFQTRSQNIMKIKEFQAKTTNFENHNISVLEDDLLNTNLEKIASFIYFPDL